jgi:hypothetical protein
MMEKATITIAGRRKQAFESKTLVQAMVFATAEESNTPKLFSIESQTFSREPS